MALQKPYSKLTVVSGDVVQPADHNKQEDQLEALTTLLNRVWTNATKPTPGPSDLYPVGFNTDLGVYEFWNGAVWISIGGSHARLHAVDSALDHSVGALAAGDAVANVGGVIAGIPVAAPATASTIVRRDAAGRTKMVAGVAADDVAVVSQVGGGADSAAWGFPALCADQFRAGAQPDGAGVRQAQFVTLTQNLAPGDSFSLKIGALIQTLVANVDFGIGVSITATINNMEGAITPLSIYALSCKLYLIDAVNNGLIITIPGAFLGTAKFWGNVGFASKALILNSALAGREYASLAADRIACPAAEPLATNFGWQRTASQLTPGETHWSRLDEILKSVRDYTAAVAWT